MSWFATNVVSAFLLPPFNLILLGMLGVLLLKCKPGLGKAMVVVRAGFALPAVHPARGRRTAANTGAGPTPQFPG